MSLKIIVFPFFYICIFRFLAAIFSVPLEVLSFTFRLPKGKNGLLFAEQCSPNDMRARMPTANLQYEQRTLIF